MNNLAQQESSTDLLPIDGIVVDKEILSLFAGINHNIVSAKEIQKLETKELEKEQVNTPVRHIFGAGIYIRELSAPAGTFLIGHKQTTKHMNHMVSGRVLMLKDDGSIGIVEAPFTGTMKAGRKIGMVLEDMVWQNIYPTDETDVEVLEATYLDKSSYSKENDKRSRQVEWIMHTPDREDYMWMLNDLNVTHDTVVTMSEYTEDQIPFPSGTSLVMVSDSPIQGKGLFATANIKLGDTIAPARLNNKRTPAGRFTNHGAEPNSKMIKIDNGDMMLVAIKDIKGMSGGELGDELTVDYRQTAKESGGLE